MDPHFFGTEIFLGLTIFGPQIVSRPQIFSDSKFHRTKNFLWTQDLLRTKNILRTVNIFWFQKIFVWPKLYSDPHLLLVKKILGTRKFYFRLNLWSFLPVPLYQLALYCLHIAKDRRCSDFCPIEAIFVLWSITNMKLLTELVPY